jgi:hypothetical protein
MPEIHGAHKCTCARNWEGIDFQSSSLKADGSLELMHMCDQHKDEWCVHVLNAKTVALIRQAIEGAQTG